MAGFQVANFSFGKNIKDDERQRMQIAAQTATTRRGQDIQAAQADARLAEDSRQFDERMAGEQERLAEGARQFDETQALKKQEYADRRADAERAQSWTDALNEQRLRKEEQEIEKRRVEFEAQSAQLDAYLRMKQQEDEQMANRRKMTESGYGNMAILAQLQNGVVTKRQTDEFNRSMLKDGLMEEGREYNYIGTVDQTTGKPFADERLHFMRYALDGNGRVRRDEKSGQPIVEIDNPLNPEIRNAALSTYFGNVKEFMGNRGGMSEERMQLERDRIDQRRLEEDGRNSRAGSKNAMSNARLAAAVARNMDDIKRGLGLDDVSAAGFQSSLTKILSDALGGGEEAAEQTPPRQATPSPGPQMNETRETGNGGRTDEAVRKSHDGVAERSRRTAAEIRRSPQDGDELPLKGGGRARYNARTGKWEKAD